MFNEAIFRNVHANTSSTPKNHLFSFFLLLLFFMPFLTTQPAQAQTDIETGLIEERWCPSQCECFNNYETVDCSRRGLVYLPRLSQATHKLYLENNKLQDLSETSFQTSSRLQVLILEHNRLLFLTTASFCSLHHLQELDLSSNQLSLFKVHLDPNDNFLEAPFSSSHNTTLHSTPTGLSGVNTSANYILTTPTSYPIRQTRPGSFNDAPETSKVPGKQANDVVNDVTPAPPTDNFSENFRKCECVNLKEINLSHNQLKSIPYAVARFAPNLEILNLAYNQITSMRFDATYSLMSSLHYLDMSRNDIRTLVSEDLQAFKKAGKLSLETINLSDCGLMFIEQNAFLDLPSLSSLSLARSLVNKSTLENVFISFPSDNHLSRLDLSEMFLSNITLKMLSNFKRLTSLLASYCDIETVEEGVFDTLSNLETLHLEGGQLTSLRNVNKLKSLRRISLHLNQLNSVTLNGSSMLEYVDLSYNKLSDWKAGWLLGSEEIQQVNMSHNQLTYLSREAFRRVFAISILDFSHNAISTLSSLGNLKITHLHLSANSISSIGDDFFDILHQTLVSLDLSHNLFTMFSPSFKIFHQLQTLNLANNRLGGAFKSDELGNLMDSLQSVQILDLSSNGIASIREGHLQPLSHLHTLLLHDNKVRALADASLDGAKLLSKLVISRNQLHTLEVQVLSNLEYLEELDASDNPFECTCDLADFLRWTNSTQTAVLSNHGQLITYLCDYPPDLYGVPIFDQEVEAKMAACPFVYASFVAAGGASGGSDGGGGGFNGVNNGEFNGGGGGGIKDGDGEDHKTPEDGVGGGYSSSSRKEGGYEVIGVNYYNEDNKIHHENNNNNNNNKNNNEPNNKGLELYGGKYLVASMAFLCLIGGVGCVGVTCYVTQIFKKVKSLKYRWQIRYREVSAVENGDYK